MNIFKQIWNKKDAALWITFLRIIIGFEWFLAGLDKVAGGTFASGLATTFNVFIYGTPFPVPADPILNPHVWMANWMNAMIPNATVFGNLVAWGELLIGIGLILGALTNISALVGIFFNFLFFFAAGWLSASTFSINWILWGLSIILILSPGSKKIGIDGLAAKYFPFLRRWLVDWFGFDKEAKEPTEQVK